MGTNAGNILTLANSIIGVSVLAMPFCFKQCGIVLSILMLLFSSLISRLACYFLIKSALLEKRKNFEMLAFRVYGPTGKLMVELCIIGFMLGTCVAFFVIMGDLGPAILGPPLGFDHPSALRPSVLIGVAVFVVLPLGLLRNVDSLNTISAASILFYVCLVLKVLGEATGNIISWSWIDKVHLWRPAGILQCIPIFSMALSCQTQLFEIFDGLLNTPLDRMNSVVRTAINMTTAFYIFVGLFGYIAFCNQSFTGNVMMNFSPTLWSEVIKVGFVLSVAVSFPLVIFPCRASIHSLIFSKQSGHGYELVGGSSHIPETRFQCITLVIVTSSLVVGLVMPNIEVVLGLVGSTIGVFICVIIPAILFTSLSTKNTNERIIAQILIGIGLIIMIVGTYANLSATQEVVRENHLPDIRQEIKIKSPIIQDAVTEIPAKVPADFIVKEEKTKEIVLDSKKSKLPEEIKLINEQTNLLEKNLPNRNDLLPKLQSNEISNSQKKQEKKDINENNGIFKESILGAKVISKLEKDNAPPVANPEPPPKEIPKAVPVLPLDLAPELRDDKPLKAAVAPDMKIDSLSLADNLKNEPVALNFSNEAKVKDTKLKVDEILKDTMNVLPRKLEESEPAGKKAPIREINPLKSLDTIDKKPVDKLTMSMAQGVPLPLAVKDAKTIEEMKNIVKEKELPVKEVDEMKKQLDDKKVSNEKKINNLPVERELLENKIEIREKRDIEDEIETNQKLLENKEINKDIVKTEQKDEGEIKLQEKEEINEENCPRPTVQSKNEDNVEKIQTEKDDNIIIIPSEQTKLFLKQEKTADENLIKIPVKLSNPESKLDTDPKIISENQLLQGDNAIMPKKRDLKSVERNEDK